MYVLWAHSVFNRLSGGSKYLNNDYESWKPDAGTPEQCQCLAWSSAGSKQSVTQLPIDRKREKIIAWGKSEKKWEICHVLSNRSFSSFVRKDDACNLWEKSLFMIMRSIQSWELFCCSGWLYSHSIPFIKKCQWNDKNVYRYNQQFGQSTNPPARSVWWTFCRQQASSLCQLWRGLTVTLCSLPRVCWARAVPPPPT